jgi:glutathione reductase (NADPH)
VGEDGVRDGVIIDAVLRAAQRILGRQRPLAPGRGLEPAREIGDIADRVNVWLGRAKGRIHSNGLAAVNLDRRPVQVKCRRVQADGETLTAGGIEAGARGVVVNEYLQSVTNPAVYAGGDSAASAEFRLTPVADLDGGVIAANLLKGNRRQPDYSVVPTVVFSIPPLAAVRLQEDTARARGLQFTVKHEDASDWYASRRIGNRFASYKVLVENETDRILGAHFFGPHADDVINLFALAMCAGVKATDVRHTLYAYPSVSGDISSMV